MPRLHERLLFWRTVRDVQGSRTESHLLLLDHDVIRYRARGLGEWELPLANVRVIGEATNDHGPFLDDYFLCFATTPDVWYEASFYAPGCPQFLQDLSVRLGYPLSLSLIASTDFASHVLWPPTLAGQPMFTFAASPPRNWLLRLLGISRNEQRFSDSVAHELARRTATC